MALGATVVSDSGKVHPAVAETRRLLLEYLLKPTVTLAGTSASEHPVGRA